MSPKMRRPSHSDNNVPSKRSKPRAPLAEVRWDGRGSARQRVAISDGLQRSLRFRFQPP